MSASSLLFRRLQPEAKQILGLIYIYWSRFAVNLHSARQIAG